MVIQLTALICVLNLKINSKSTFLKLDFCIFENLTLLCFKLCSYAPKQILDYWYSNAIVLNFS